LSLTAASRKVSAQLKSDTPSTDNPLGRVLAAYDSNRNADTETIELKLSEAGLKEMPGLTKGLLFIKVISVVAPLMGLLGTIFGMITAFQTVAVSGEALGKTELLAGGIYEAMITTAAGLIVAIPVLIGYHWLSARIDRLVMDIDQMTVDFIEVLAGMPASPDEPGTESDDGQASAFAASPLKMSSS